MTKTLRVNEIFTSIQGEGLWTGTPCTFIRLQGCSLKCIFCDSKATWDLNGGTEMTIPEVVAAVRPTIPYVVITGGEPTLQENIIELVRELIWVNHHVHVETNGVHYGVLKKLSTMSYVWITISPKYHRLPTLSALLLADEIKWIIRKEQDLRTVDEVWEKLVYTLPDPSTFSDPPTFFLQPVSQDPNATELCVKHVIQNAAREYRLSIQVHKYIGIK